MPSVSLRHKVVVVGLLEEQDSAFGSTSKATVILGREIPCCFFSFGAAKVFYDTLVWHLAKAWEGQMTERVFFWLYHQIDRWVGG